MKDLLKRIIFEQQDFCKDIAVTNIPRKIEGHIITMDEKETIQTDSGVIHVVPVWEWMLG